MLLEHRLHFHGRAGQQHEDHAVVCDPLARRGAALVGQYLRAFDDVSLAAIDLGHLAAKVAQARLDAIADVLLKNQRAAQRAGHRIARQVIFGWPQAAGQHYNFRSRRRAQDAVGQPFALVADHRLAHYFHTQRIELIGEIQRVGVEPLRRQQFRADGDDLRVRH